MNKRSIAGLLLFGCLVMSILIYGAIVLTGSGKGADASQSRITDEKGTNTSASEDGSEGLIQENTLINAGTESGLLQNAENIGISGSEAGGTVAANPDRIEKETEKLSGSQNTLGAASPATEESVDVELASVIETGAVLVRGDCRLIVDSTQVDYEAYIPEQMATNSALEAALQIENPGISLKAKSAILLDAETMEVLYYKNPLEPVFPASTAKLLTCLVVLDWCSLEEEVEISNEIRMIARDSTIAGLYPGQVLTIKNLLEGMLLPSGNDAAYAAATYVGRKSLRREGARREDAVAEFVCLMNDKAKQLGALNSSFQTPDGYDAIGQYTTAYDMGLIGIAAMKNEVILEISMKSNSHNRFPSGDQVTWRNTNALVRKDSGRYYAPCIGLKTGTSTMAGKCLIAAGKLNGRKVLCAIMNSTQTGRWSDARALLDYGLQ